MIALLIGVGVGLFLFNIYLLWKVTGVEIENSIIEIRREREDLETKYMRNDIESANKHIDKVQEDIDGIAEYLGVDWENPTNKVVKIKK